MTKVLITGADGFLGWHTRVRLRTMTNHTVVPVNRSRWANLLSLVSDCDQVIHVAGINRAGDEELEHGNVQMADELIGALRSSHRDDSPWPDLVYAGSIQSDGDSPYGRGKATAGHHLREATEAAGSRFREVRLPNLFGEHARPGYNSFVATFAQAVAEERLPANVSDRTIELLHAQDAAHALMSALAHDDRVLRPTGTSISVTEVLSRLSDFRRIYRGGDVPLLSTRFDEDLFNTLRSVLFPDHYPQPLTTHADDRGRLVETVRCHGAGGQTFISTTRPRKTRGEHYHLRKLERFVVVAGRARISLRRLFHDQVTSFDVSGDEPAIVDMPTMWVHNITNTGDTDLTTMFWTDTLFDPEHPDTYWEPV